jgi:chemotaxis protein CheD
VIEKYLQPGEFYFGGRHTRIRTILGSCIAITIWHPEKKIGGMCHYMLPSRGASEKNTGQLDGRYADEAMQLFAMEVGRHGTRPSEYEVKVFGGGNMFPRHTKTKSHGNVAEKNVEAAHALIKKHGFSKKVEEMGGMGHRQVIFDVNTGHVWVRRHDLASAEEE